MGAFPNLEQQFLAWESYVSRQKILPEVDPLVANSWKRCWSLVKHEQEVRPRQLTRDHLLAAQVVSFDLLSIARPVMEDIYQYVEHSQTGVVLVNGAGYILDILGDEPMLSNLRKYGISVGGHCAETQIGTNAFAIALTERVPAKVVGPEHYLRQFHGLADAAAPIFDLTGHPMGAFGVVTSTFYYHPHSLGLAVAGARAIEGQRQADYLMAEQNTRLAELNAIMEANSEGILVWSADLVLMRINAAAAKIIGVPIESVVGRRVSDLLTYPAFVARAIERREPLTDVEATIQYGQRVFNCFLSLRHVSNGSQPQWIVATFRQIKDVRQLVQQQFGTHARLTMDDVIGESPEIRRVRRLVKSAAAARASILIRGEGGTGKNVLASAIHNESPRREGPFLIFPCSSVPTELVISELLGNDEEHSGSKPGGRPSKFELAHGGTLFFQDIDALPLEAQTILLNVLDLGIVQRLGSGRPLAVDVRILASTSANMEKLVSQGSFRADLFYRLAAFEIDLPALRDRLKDLPILVEKTISRLSRQLNHPVRVAPETVDLLRRYAWPGNVRELEAVLGRAVMQAGSGELIIPAHLPDFIQRSTRYATPSLGAPQVQPLEYIQREALLQAARSCRGNMSEMARLLGIGRTTVWRKLKEFDIPVQEYRNGHNL